MRTTTRKLRSTRPLHPLIESAYAHSGGEQGYGEGGVIELLNMKGNPGSQPVAELVEIFHIAAEQVEAAKLSPSPDSRILASLNRLLPEILNRLSKYEWTPAVFVNMGQGSNFKHEFRIIGKIDDANLVFEHYAVQWIIDHLDLIPRVRRCRFSKCRKWFFARTEHQKFCADGNCRQSNASQGEEFKEKRRVYMKKYRKDQADRDKRERDRAKQLARGKSK